MASEPVSQCVKIDQSAEFKVALVKLKDGKLYAIPSNAIPSNMKAYAIPSNAIPSNAIPSNALPASAIPSNALPASALARELLKAQAIPSNAIPSNITVSNLQSGVVNFVNIWNALPASGIPSNFIAIPFEPVESMEGPQPLQLAGIGAGVEAFGGSEWLQQFTTQGKSSLLCQGEFVPSLQKRTCTSADLLPSQRSKCEGGKLTVAVFGLAPGLAGSIQLNPTQASPTAASGSGGSSSGGSGSGQSGGSTPGNTGGGETGGEASACDQPYTGLVAYSGALSDPNLFVFLRTQVGDSFDDTPYYLRLGSSGENYTCSREDLNRLACYGPHVGTQPVTVTYTLFLSNEDCQVATGSLYLDYSSASSSPPGGNDPGVEYGEQIDENGCYEGDAYSKIENLCCDPSDYYPQWDSCDPPTYEPLD